MQIMEYLRLNYVESRLGKRAKGSTAPSHTPMEVIYKSDPSDIADWQGGMR